MLFIACIFPDGPVWRWKKLLPNWISGNLCVEVRSDKKGSGLFFSFCDDASAFICVLTVL